MVDSIANLISAVARLAWPALALMLILIFRHNIRSLMDRIYHAKFLGSEFEFERDQLRNNIKQIEASESTINSSGRRSGEEHADNSERRVLEWNKKRIQDDLNIRPLQQRVDDDPAYAIVLISGAVENALGRILADYAVSSDQRGVRQMARIARQFGYGDAFQEAVARFSNIRNMIVHGQNTFEPSDLREVARLGLRILDYITLREAQPVFVERAGLPLYVDQACTSLLTELEGIVLLYGAIPGATGAHVLAATLRKSHYRSGEEVLPVWNTFAGYKTVHSPEEKNIAISFLNLEEHGLFAGKRISEVLQMPN